MFDLLNKIRVKEVVIAVELEVEELARSIEEEVRVFQAKG